MTSHVAVGSPAPDFFGMQGVSKRSAFVVDREGIIRYAWVSEDADAMPAFEEIFGAVKALG